MTTTDNLTAPVEYIPDIFDGAAYTADAAFETLSTQLDWERRDGVPRSEFYMNDHDAPYTYGTGEFARTYTRRPWHLVALDVRHILEARYACAFDVCFLNMYHDERDQLGWHADDSPEMDPERPIVTVSLGAVREIQFRRAPDPAGPRPHRSFHDAFLTLAHGSAAVMLPGMQQEWQHRIPKSSAKCGTRISLTYRGYTPGA